MYRRLAVYAPKRRISMCHRSKLGSPSTIHSAITLPTPPAPEIPCAQNPQAAQKPFTSGDSPRINSPSGVNDSRPLTRLTNSTFRRVGTRLTLPRNRLSKRGGSKLSTVGFALSGMASTLNAAGSRSYPPNTMHSPSCRK